MTDDRSRVLGFARLGIPIERVVSYPTTLAIIVHTPRGAVIDTAQDVDAITNILFPCGDQDIFSLLDQGDEALEALRVLEALGLAERATRGRESALKHDRVALAFGEGPLDQIDLQLHRTEW